MMPSWLSPWAVIALAFLGLSVAGMIMNMPTLTLTLGTLEALGLSRADLSESTLRLDVQHPLEPVLASRGFDVTRTIRVHELTGGAGFVLTQ
jgi:hypothetical protein